VHTGSGTCRAVLGTSSAKLFHGVTQRGDVEDHACVGAVCEMSLDMGVICTWG